MVKAHLQLKRKERTVRTESFIWKYTSFLADTQRMPQMTHAHHHLVGITVKVLKEIKIIFKKETHQEKQEEKGKELSSMEFIF